MINSVLLSCIEPVCLITIFFFFLNYQKLINQVYEPRVEIILIKITCHIFITVHISDPEFDCHLSLSPCSVLKFKGGHYI